MKGSKMFRSFIKMENLALKLIIPVGLVLFASIFVWSHFTIKIQEKALFERAVSDVDKFCNTVLNFTWFAMLHNPDPHSQQDMQEFLKSISDYNQIERIRLFNTQGEIRFSNNNQEISTRLETTDVACKTCHENKTPELKKEIKDRVRTFESDSGELQLGIIHPIFNQPTCSNSQCHYHPKEVKKLGTLDVVISLKNIQNTIAFSKKLSAWTAVFLFVILGIIICVCIFFLVTGPIQRLIAKTTSIGKGEYKGINDISIQRDEIGKLSSAILDMGKKIKTKQDQLNRQKDLYQNLFDQVPCTITVQNRDYKLIEFNKVFADNFNPAYGDHCFKAYKNQEKKCDDCPVERTFLDGQPHFSEEAGVNKDGTTSHWFVKTAPLKDESGKIVAAMEMSIDISKRKKLEENVKESERKYQTIFKTIPNPVFILEMETYRIVTCNDSALEVYGYKKEELKDKPFSLLFPDAQLFEQFIKKLDQPFHEKLLNQRKDNNQIYVRIWLSPAKFSDKEVLLVTIVDITESVEAQQQLIQAGKMATLGEMATGVAHELNQPLSVIKTASSFIATKISKNEPIETEILATLSQEIESHVDRAAKITNHMRLFGRRSKLTKEAVDINDTIQKAVDIFSQQLKLREIKVNLDLDMAIPLIQADPMRLEQVFINLLINARDAIVTKAKKNQPGPDTVKKITIVTFSTQDHVTAKIIDTGIGIPEENIDKIFEPFFTTKRVGKGTGLGLSISYGIIKESGGEISIENNLDGGVTFTICFPAGSGG